MSKHLAGPTPDIAPLADEIAATAPAPSDRQVFTEVVERVAYQNAGNGFCVLRVKARGHRELVTLVGGRIAQEFIAAIECCGAVLATHAPPTDTGDELPNRIYVM